MCTMIVQRAEMTGSAKGPNGWFRVQGANVSYDHPFHAPLEHAVNIDLVNPADGLDQRVAVELTPASARELVRLISEALERGEREHGLEAG